MARPTTWKSSLLKKRTLIPMVLLEVGIIVTILVLERLSASHNGITSVRSVPSIPILNFSITNISWSYGLLWTALPAFLMTLYRMAWDAVVNATADRQPFLELSHTEAEASNMRKTVMLDYRNYPSWYSWAIAFSRGHCIIGMAMLLSIVLSVAVVPLTSHLLAASSTFISAPINLTSSNSFDDQAVNAQTDLQAAINIAGAVSVFDATPPPWSTDQYAFDPFNTSDVAKVGNITANVTAYSALLDCRVLTGSDISVTSSDGTVTVQGIDRDCSMPSQNLITSTNESIYMLSWSTVQCDAAAHYSRFGIIAASASNTSANQLAHFTVLSCIPSYWTTQGQLTVEHTSSGSPAFAGFSANESSAQEIRPFFYKVLENSLSTYKSFDVSNTFQTDAWGRLVYQLASRMNSSDPLDSTNVKNSMETLWSSFFASLASTYLFPSTGTSRQFGGIFTEQVTRLFVVPPVAWTIAAVLCLVLICNIFLITYSRKREFVLKEEPRGLLGSAVLLQDSDLFNILTQLRGQPPAPIPVRRTLERTYKLDAIRCWYDRESNRIRVSGFPFTQNSDASTPLQTPPRNADA
ncbi:uncharacterized protein PV09_07915 [Verruconis gallopava]|uniref:Uncharacterized protein n=1 Tax=Verruconis gallopava TaxID=253628 RepID=A0A0D1XEG4_9PEZI|nr:uncharacterized protein PV09_07915 [Verruconis gallopava]KIW00561.1 hypothetical protein PV09_07915 [Verruconis gallopava]